MVLVKSVPAVPASTLAFNSIVTVAPLANVPTVQSGLLHVPVLGVAFSNVKPKGRLSVTFRLVASEGPLFLTVIVNVTVSPSFTVVLPATLLNTISASVG